MRRMEETDLPDDEDHHNVEQEDSNECSTNSTGYRFHWVLALACRKCNKLDTAVREERICLCRSE